MLSKDAIDDAGLLSNEGVANLFALHDAKDTTAATHNTLDAVFNHMIGVQILHEQFVNTDIPALARERARELGWSAQAV